MKAGLTLFSSLLFCLFSFSLTATSVSRSNPFGDNDKCLELKGTLMSDGKKLADLEISLLIDGKVVEEFVSKGTKDIKFKLVRDKEYSLVVKKEGFVPAVIVISTKMPATIKEYNYHYHVEFQYDMIPQQNSLNKEYLDYPAAYVMYYKTKDEFAVSQKYVKHIKKCLGKS